MQLNQQVKQLIETLASGLHEREEIVAVALLGALSGQNTFLFGPPGTAKSLISRRIACAFSDANYFEYLMNRFSTPDEVFGPISIKALKQDKYTRKTNGYLPTADFAFLDEIWKSSPAVLNTLLTITNERVFRNGEETVKTPLKALIAASNETPAEGQGLEALYDRFIIRMMVPPMQSREKFEALLQGEAVTAEINVPDTLKITTQAWLENLGKIHTISLSQETLTIISLIRIALEQQFDKLNVYVSDRRWQKAALLMKASAMFCDRETTNHSDTLLLRHCLWTSEDNRQAVIDIVENAVRDCGIDPEIDISAMDIEKDRLDKEIHDELYYREDVYDTTILGDGQEYFKVSTKYKPYQKPLVDLVFYIKLNQYKSIDQFNPNDDKGQEIKWVRCNFDGQGSCSIETQEDHSGDSHDYWNKGEPFKPEILFTKGSKKQQVNRRLIASLKESSEGLKSELSCALDTIETVFLSHSEDLISPFVAEEQRNIAIEGIQQQVEDLQLRIVDCERLIELCR